MVSPVFFFLIIYVIFNKNIRECATNDPPQNNISGPGEVYSTDVNQQNQAVPESQPVVEDADVVASTEETTSTSPVQTTSVSSESGTTASIQGANQGGDGSHQPSVSSQSGSQNQGPSALNTNGSGVSTVISSNADGTSDTGAVTQAASVTDVTPPQNIPVKSALLKNSTGVKITGSCGAYFQLVFVPHITFNFETDDGKIELIQKFAESETIQVQFTNKCEQNGTFKFIVFIKGDVLTLRWEVTSTGNDVKKETKKYRVVEFSRPIMSIQVHTGKADENLIESKNYVVKNVMPEQCDAITTDCFLSGNLDIEKCYHCTLLVKNVDSNSECFKFVAPDTKSKFEESIVSAASDDDETETSEYRLIESIDNILKRIYKTDETNLRRELITLDELDDELKEEIKNYCALLKEVDSSGTLENHELGNEIEVFQNLTRLLRVHEQEEDLLLPSKLRNAAICIKNVDEWIINKRGLVLPNVTNEYFDKVKDMPAVEEDEDYEDNINVTDDMFPKDENNIIDLTKSNKEMKLLSPYFRKNKYCNDEYCDRWKDKTSCISKIEIEDQGHCGVCWIFASKLHLETIRCMRGYGHFRSSPLYVANCSKRKPKYRCTVGSSPIEFLKIIEENGFLPLETDHPYSYQDVGRDCPRPKKKWVNLWGDTKLLEYINYSQYTYSKGYISYESINYKNNIDSFIKIVKREIQNKGSVVAYIKTKDVFSFDFSGRGVHNLCGHEIPDHAANIIGYGNYINARGEKRSYWLVRNSWGFYWGDQGTFKVDMHGPRNCQYHFIHTALVFKLNLGMVKVPDQKEQSNPFSIFLKNSPEFYHRLYYKNYDPKKSKKSAKDKNIPIDNVVNNNDADTQNGIDDNSMIYGSEDEHAGGSGSPTTNGEKNAIKHILKDIKNKRVRSSLIKYADEDDIEKEHSCSRTYSLDPAKDGECRKFCVDNFDKCKGFYSPGYCLTKLRNTNDCFFCSV